MWDDAHACKHACNMLEFGMQPNFFLVPVF